MDPPRTASKAPRTPSTGVAPLGRVCTPLDRSSRPPHDRQIRPSDAFGEYCRVTRRQRATYATQGGFPDEYVASLGVDIEDLHNEAIDAIETLNKATHVRPQTIQKDPGAVDAFVAEALGALEGLLISFSECRSAVQNALEKSVYESMMNALVTENFDTISLLSGRGYEVDLWIDDDEVEVVSLSAEKVLVRFSGIAPVTMHYGPKNDAAEISHDFPFWMIFEAKVEKPTEMKLIDHFFDDSGWFE